MALNKFQEADPPTGMGGSYCKIMAISAHYDSNKEYSKPEERGWQKVDFTFWVWKDREAYEQGKSDIYSKRFTIQIDSSLVSGFTIQEDNEETLAQVYEMMKAVPEFAGATDC